MRTISTIVLPELRFLLGALAGVFAKIFYDKLAEPKLQIDSKPTAFRLPNVTIAIPTGDALESQGSISSDVVAYRVKIRNSEKLALNAAARNCIAWLDIEGATEPYQLCWVGSKDSVTINVGDSREVDVCALLEGYQRIFAPTESGYNFPTPRLIGAGGNAIRGKLRVTAENGRPASASILIKAIQTDDELIISLGGGSTMIRRAGFSRVVTVTNKTGLLVGLMYTLCALINFFSITNQWLRLPSRLAGLRRISWIWDERYKKSTPVWQDIPCVIIFCTALLFARATVIWTTESATIGISWLSFWLLLDVVCYHLNLLWLEAMRQTFRGGDVRVWSHVRVVFQTFVNLASTIVLFAILYGTVAHNAIIGRGFMERLLISIISGLTFNMPKQLEDVHDVSLFIWVAQEVVSILLILGVLPSLMSFKRDEIVDSINLETKPKT